MTVATTNGNLNEIFECYIQIGNDTIILNNLPDIGDSKSAEYQTENAIGRSSPLITYSASTKRVITMQLHFFVVEPSDVEDNLEYLRLIQSAVYPRRGEANGAPFTPPVVCRIKCGELLAKEPLCCILESYSVKFPTEVAWATNGVAQASKFTPFKFDVDTTWTVVYSSNNLPYNDRIITSGR